jgi:hypothetical protein
MPTTKKSKETKLYKCDMCEATFTDPKMLEKHKRTHITAGLGGGQGAEPEPPLEGQPRTPPSSPAPEPTPPATTGP